MNTPTTKLAAAAICSLFLGFPALSIHAQGDDTDEVIELSPFEVSTKSIRGYATTSSLGASRIAVPVTDIAASVITLNENFIDDTLAIDLGDTLNVVANVFQGGLGGGRNSNDFSIRGYQSTSAQRDGLPDLAFGSRGGFDYGYVQRIEIIKGPAGALYGSHNPGGVLNLISKMPLSENMLEFSGMMGSWNRKRIAADANLVTGTDDRLRVRLSGAWYDTDGVDNLPFKPEGGTTVLNPSVSYVTENGWKFWGWSNFVRDNSSRHATNVYAFGGRLGDRAQVLTRIADGGVYEIVYHNLNEARSDSFEIGTSKSFSLDPVDFDLRVVYRTAELFDSNSRTRGIGQRNFIDTSGNTIDNPANGNPYTDARDIPFAAVDDELAKITRSGIRFDNANDNTEADLLAVDLTMSFESGALNHQSLVYFQTRNQEFRSDLSFYDIQNVAALPEEVRAQYGIGVNRLGIGQVTVWPRNDPAQVDFNSAFVVANASRFTNRGITVNDDELTAYGAQHRVSAFENRLIGIAGVRKDQLDGTTTVTDDSGVRDETISDGSTTYKFGLVGKPFNEEGNVMSVFLNYSETFTPVFTIDNRLATRGQRFPNRIAELKEIGIKTEWFDSRLVGTLTIFETSENNVLVSNVDETGDITGVPFSRYDLPAGERTSDGWEIDVSANPVPGLNIIASYGRIDVAFSTDEIPAGIPEFTIGTFIQYTFQEDIPILEGFSIAHQYSKWGDSYLNAQSGGPQIRGGNTQNLILGYSTGAWDFRLRIANLFDGTDPLPTNFWTTVPVTEERNYRFSVSYRY